MKGEASVQTKRISPGRREGNRREAQKSRDASVDDNKRGGGDSSVQALTMSIGFGDMLVPGYEQIHRQRMT